MPSSGERTPRPHGDAHGRRRANRNHTYGAVLSSTHLDTRLHGHWASKAGGHQHRLRSNGGTTIKITVDKQRRRRAAVTGPPRTSRRVVIGSAPAPETSSSLEILRSLDEINIREAASQRPPGSVPRTVQALFFPSPKTAPSKPDCAKQCQASQVRKTLRYTASLTWEKRRFTHEQCHGAKSVPRCHWHIYSS